MSKQVFKNLSRIYREAELERRNDSPRAEALLEDLWQAIFCLGLSEKNEYRLLKYFDFVF